MTTIQIKVPNWLDRICTWPLLTYRLLRFGYPFRRIPVGEGKFAIVDPSDFYWLNNFHWSFRTRCRCFYAIRFFNNPNGRLQLVQLHRDLMKAPKGLLVDHRNNDGLDNRRANLRLATPSQNNQNRRKTRSKTSSRFLGVHFVKSSRRWAAYTKYQGKKVWLGSFDNEIDAARDYDEAASRFHGEFARLNFANPATS
jgi:hypothetical protein